MEEKRHRLSLCLCILDMRDLETRGETPRKAMRLAP